MNRRILQWSALATMTVVAGIGLVHSGSWAQTPPAGQPANGAAPGPGHRPGPGQRPGQGPGQAMGQRPGPGQAMGRRPGPGMGQGRAPGQMGMPGQRRGPGNGMQRGAATAPATALVPPPPPRVHRMGVDPFRVPWTVPAPPPYVFEDILPVRLASDEVEPPVKEKVTVREEPALRVSGIMTGDGVFAILEEGGGKVDIVKPGSSVDIAVSGGSRSYRVASIKDDTVTLESVDGNVTFQQIVPLSDAPIGTNAGSFGGGIGGPPMGGAAGRPNSGGVYGPGGGGVYGPGGGGGRPGAGRNQAN